MEEGLQEELSVGVDAIGESQLAILDVVVEHMDIL